MHIRFQSGSTEKAGETEGNIAVVVWQGQALSGVAAELDARMGGAIGKLLADPSYRAQPGKAAQLRFPARRCGALRRRRRLRPQRRGWRRGGAARGCRCRFCLRQGGRYDIRRHPRRRAERRQPGGGARAGGRTPRLSI